MWLKSLIAASKRTMNMTFSLFCRDPILNNFYVGGREFGSEILGAKNLSLETNLVQTLIQ